MAALLAARWLLAPIRPPGAAGRVGKGRALRAVPRLAGTRAWDGGRTSPAMPPSCRKPTHRTAVGEKCSPTPAAEMALGGPGDDRAGRESPQHSVSAGCRTIVSSSLKWEVKK